MPGVVPLADSVTHVGGADYDIVIGIAVLGVLALVVAGLLVRQVLAAAEGSPAMIDIARAVQEGAAAYLRRQFRTLAVFGVIIFAILFALPADSIGTKVGRSVFFLVGAAFSALVGLVGMTLSTRANLRTAAAAKASGLGAALKLSFRSGGVTGMFTVGLGLLGAAVVVLIFNDSAPEVLEGFGFGAAMLAMFMRVGGGIYTKAADVGADLVGKVEQNIPEDDPRNAAAIADNVGDNVGDCAGMAADLFESYAVMLVAALILGKTALGMQGLVFPLIVPGIGAVTAVLGIYAVRSRPRDHSGLSAINRGFFLSAVVSAGLVALASFLYLPSSFQGFDGAPKAIQSLPGDPRLTAFLAVLIGILLASMIQLLTGYFTETNRKPVLDIGKSSTTGAATVVLAGVSVGLESAVYTAILVGLAIYVAFLLGGGSVLFALFAVALMGTGLLTTVGVTVSMDSFGPVSDNAQGIAEMSGEVEGEGAQVLTDLDAVGNTTKAITKGIAIATAVIAATALFGSFRTSVENHVPRGLGFALDISHPNVLFGLIIGAAVVFFFSGLTINAVSRAASAVVVEVRKQFRLKPGIMDFTERPDYSRVVDICTRDSLRELATPGLLAVLAPIATGFLLGWEALGAYLAGAIAAGVLMAIFLANSGGAWDNAKKLVEDGNYGGKGSDAHEATIIGDTVGDPFKDTAGPSLDPLIKVMNLVALLVAPTVVEYGVNGGSNNLAIRISAGVIALLIIGASVLVSKRRVSDIDAGEPTEPVPGEKVTAA